MDSRMIDVAIGLVLVLMLASLLATMLQEAWNSFFNLRGDVLALALESFVGDDAKFAQALRDHPLLVSLSEDPQGKRMPSYMPADAVVAALLHGLQAAYFQGARPATPAEFVRLIADNKVRTTAAVPNAQFIESLRSLLPGAESDWPAFEKRVASWYDAVGERSTGWFKRRLRVRLFGIGMLIAVTMNINPILIGQRLWDDPVLRKDLADAGQKLVEEKEKQQAAAAAPAGTASRPSTPAPDAGRPPVLREWARTIDGYQAALARALGAARPASRDEQAILQAGDRVDRVLAVSAAWPQDGAEPQPGLRDELRLSIDSAAPPLAPDSELRWLHSHHRELRAFADRHLLAGPKARNCTDTTEDQLRCLLETPNLPLGWGKGVAPWPLFDCESAKRQCLGGTFAVPTMGELWFAFSGWFLTALACTLGAPFWFDLLGRLVRLRASGGKPEESAATPAGTGTGVLARSAEASGSAPAPADAKSPMSDALNAAEAALAVTEVQRIQRALGLQAAEVTGVLDGPTRRAIQAWQQDRGDQPSGELTETQARRLLEAATDQEDDYLG